MKGVRVEFTIAEGSTLEAVVEEDIAKFNEGFQALGNGPLNKFEHAILKTYLRWKAEESKDV